MDEMFKVGEMAAVDVVFKFETAEVFFFDGDVAL